MKILLLVILVAILRVQSVISSSNQTLLYGFTAKGQGNGIEYRRSLHILLSTFQSQTLTKAGFYNSTAIRQTPNGQLSGLYFCRGDVNQQQCRDCVSYAKHAILTKQPYFTEEAMYWYDHCMVRYSNKPFLGKLDFNTGFSSWNLDNITTDRCLFKQTLRDTMKVLKLRAAYDRSASKFATRVVKLTGDESLYALAQCTPDLSPNDCNMCLINAIGGIRRMRNSTGGKVMRLNCMVRYETFPFFYSSEFQSMPISPHLEATSSMMIRLRVQLLPLSFRESSMNSTSSNVSSIMADNSTATRVTAQLLIPPVFSNKTMKLRLWIPSKSAGNSTVIEEEGADQVNTTAMEQ